MKLSKSVMFGAAACLLSTSASAQAAGDLLALSQYNYSFSTARSAALGGAFTSLGADLSSMSINPAGLGMYMSSDFGISPSLTWNNMQSTYLGTKSDYSRTRFTLGNLGMAFNLYQGSGTLTSFTLGVGYSKLADFNTTSAAYGQGIDKSITDVLAEYMNGVPLSSLGHPDNDPYQPFRRADVGLWGGILAYQTGILDPMSDAQDNKQYTVANNLATGSRTNPSMRNVNKGSIDEYSISGGFNIQNILYLGFTIGIQDILYRNDNYYVETYDNNSLPLNGMNYIRSLHLDGTGVNFKFGAVVRPVENLRIGVAVHTPTLVSINEEYIEWMSASLAERVRYQHPDPTPDGHLLHAAGRRTDHGGLRAGLVQPDEAAQHGNRELGFPADDQQRGLELLPAGEQFPCRPRGHACPDFLHPGRIRQLRGVYRDQRRVQQHVEHQLVRKLLGRSGLPVPKHVCRSGLYLYRI